MFSNMKDGSEEGRIKTIKNALWHQVMNITFLFKYFK